MRACVVCTHVQVAVPDLDRPRVDPMIFERAWSNINGLAKLLLLEKLTTPLARFQVLCGNGGLATRPCAYARCMHVRLCVVVVDGLEFLGNSLTVSQYKERHKASQMRRRTDRQTMSYLRDAWLSERIEEAMGTRASDYSTVFMPWGPNWNATKIAKMVRG